MTIFNTGTPSGRPLFVFHLFWSNYFEVNFTLNCFESFCYIFMSCLTFNQELILNIQNILKLQIMFQKHGRFKTTYFNWIQKRSVLRRQGPLVPGTVFGRCRLAPGSGGRTAAQRWRALIVTCARTVHIKKYE